MGYVDTDDEQGISMTADALLDGRLKLRHIRFVLMIAEHKTLVRAADALFVTQPVVTRALSETEEILGNDLFVRGPKGVTPTEFGEEFLRDAAVIVARLRDVQRRVDLRADGKGGRLFVGNHLSGSTSVLPQAITAFKRECPEATVSVREASPDQLVELLRGGVVDVVVGRLSEQFRDSDFALEELLREPVRVVARAGHPLTAGPSFADGPEMPDGSPIHARSPLTLSQLRDEAWILPLPQTALRREVEWCFAQEGVPVPANLIETTSAVMMRAILLGSDTIAVMPQFLAESQPELRILPVELNVERSVGMITQSARESMSLLDRFLQTLRDQSKTIQAKPEF